MKTIETSRVVRRLYVTFLPFIVMLGAGFVITTTVLLPSTDPLASIRFGIRILLPLMLALMMYFIHHELLRRTSVFQGFAQIEPAQLPVITSDIFRELSRYPYRIASYVFVLGIGLVILFYALFHAYSGSSFTDGLTELLTHLFLFTLWLGPFAILLYVFAENAVRNLIFRLFTPEQWMQVDFSDYRLHLFNYRIKHWIIYLLPMASYLILFTALAHFLSSLFHPILVGFYIWFLVYFGLITNLSASGIQRAANAADATLQQIIQKKPLSSEDLQQLILFTRDEVGTAVRNLFELCVKIIPEMIHREKLCALQNEKFADFAAIAKNQNTVSYSQASALSQLATTMEEIVQSVNQIASDAMKTSQMTQQGLNKVQHGKQFLEQTLDSIEQIHQESMASSQRIMDLSLKMVQIEDVVRIINYVTDHTKILAFNAAIETASAGELGERFGVVATEIRKLAQHISDSTEEIKKIINEVKKTAHASVITTEKELKQVNLAVKTANEAQFVFNDIHTAIEEASNAVNNISAAISQQRLVHEQVWNSIKDIDLSAKQLLDKNRQMVELIGNLNSLADKN